MNKNLKSIALLFVGAISMTSCTNNDTPTSSTETPVVAATPTEFAAVRTEALTNLTQKFTVTQATGTATVTTDKGVKISINRDALRKNGVAVTGPINIEYAELFDKGQMLVTNKPTMGLTTDGKKDLLVSAGEFYIKASQDGVALETLSNITLLVPTSLTNGVDTAMVLKIGNIEDTENLVWKNVAETTGTNNEKAGVQIDANNYHVSLTNFGWANVSHFNTDTRLKTTVLVHAPGGYNNTNSAVYISYDGKGQTALYKLDTFTTEGFFSEHESLIPIGLACHIIFATEEKGQWKYAIKAVTITENGVYKFELSETTVGTEAQLKAAITAIK
jgi:hypothetical protein